MSVRAFSHRLGASSVSFFAAPALFDSLGGAFPACLDGAPMLMPGEESAVGRHLRSWFQARALHLNVVAEFDDRALAQKFGRRGAGIFIGPTVLSNEIEGQYGARALGVAAGLEDEFFAISVERRIRHPCVIVITEAARSDFLAARPPVRPPAKPRARSPAKADKARLAPAPARAAKSKKLGRSTRAT